MPTPCSYCLGYSSVDATRDRRVSRRCMGLSVRAAWIGIDNDDPDWLGHFLVNASVVLNSRLAVTAALPVV
jgi:hypothetical protein